MVSAPGGCPRSPCAAAARRRGSGGQRQQAAAAVAGVKLGRRGRRGRRGGGRGLGPAGAPANERIRTRPARTRHSFQRLENASLIFASAVVSAVSVRRHDRQRGLLLDEDASSASPGLKIRFWRAARPSAALSSVYSHHDAHHRLRVGAQAIAAPMIEPSAWFRPAASTPCFDGREHVRPSACRSVASSLPSRGAARSCARPSRRSCDGDDALRRGAPSTLGPVIIGGAGGGGGIWSAGGDAARPRLAGSDVVFLRQAETASRQSAAQRQLPSSTLGSSAV